MKSFLNNKKPSISQLEKYLLCTPKSTNLASSNLPIILKETSSKFNQNEHFNTNLSDENNSSLNYKSRSFVSSSGTTDSNTKSLSSSQTSVLVRNSKKEIIHKTNNEPILRSQPIEEIDINNYHQCTTGSSCSDKPVDTSRSFENGLNGFRFLKSSARNSTEFSIDSPYDKNQRKDVDHITSNTIIESDGKLEFGNFELSKAQYTKQACNDESDFSMGKYKQNVKTCSFEYNSKQMTSINVEKTLTSSRYTERPKTLQGFETEYTASKMQGEHNLHVARPNFETNKHQDSPVQSKSYVFLEQSNQLKFSDSAHECNSCALSLENEFVHLGELVSLCMPKCSLFLSMTLQSLSSPESDLAFNYNGANVPKCEQEDSSCSFPAGLSNFYLTPRCERQQERFSSISTSIPFKTNENIKSSVKTDTELLQKICVTSSQQVLFLPLIWLLKTSVAHIYNGKNKYLSDTTIPDLPHDFLPNVLRGYNDPYQVRMYSNSPCLICLPVDLSKNKPSQRLLHRNSEDNKVFSHDLNEKTESDSLLSTGLSVCLLRERSHKNVRNSQKTSTFHFSTSSDVEFRPTELNSLVYQFHQELVKHTLKKREFCSQQTKDNKKKFLARSKQDNFYETLILQIIKNNASLCDAIWVLENPDTGSQIHNISVASTPLNVRKSHYMIRNFKGHYLVVGSNCLRKNSDQPECDLKDLRYELLSREVGAIFICVGGLSIMLVAMLSTGVAFSTNWPLEPLWFANSVKMLHSIDPDQVSCEALLFKSLDHLKNPVQSLPCNIPLYIQEKLLIEDLLFCFSGISGNFIRIIHLKDELCDATTIGSNLINKSKSLPFKTLESLGDCCILLSKSDACVDKFFSIQPSENQNKTIQLDDSLVQIAKRILSLIRFYRKICRYLEVQGDSRFGLCSQALVEGIKDVLIDFDNYIVELEERHRNGNLTLQKFWFFMQPACLIFQFLEKVVDATLGQRGGALLNSMISVYTSLSRMDSSQALCHKLIIKCAAPMTTILSHWISKGVINDPYDEFWITDDKLISPQSQEILSGETRSFTTLNVLFNTPGYTSEAPDVQQEIKKGIHPYWYSKFCLKDGYNIPNVLSLVAKNSLDAGKHLNILLSCTPHFLTGDKQFNVELSNFESHTLDTSLSLLDSAYVQKIIDASYAASTRLINQLYSKWDIKNRFLSIQRFMFFSRCDMIYCFLSFIEEEIKTTPLQTVINRLGVLMKNAISSSSLSFDPYQHTFECTLSHFSTRDVSPLLFIDQPNDIHPSVEVTHETISLASGIDFFNDGVNDSSICLRNSHPLLQVTQSNKNDSQSYSFSLNAISSSTQTSNIQKYQELLKYLTLSFRSAWPLSLIFTQVSILKYQVLSRLVLQLKFTEKKLAEIWQCQMRCGSRVTQGNAFESSSYLSYILRSRMLHFVRNLVFYVTMEVLEPRFHKFFSKLDSVTSLDELLHLHDLFLNTCLCETLLTDSNVLRCLSKILTVCHLYTSTATKFSLYRMEASNIRQVVSGLKPKPSIIAENKKKTSPSTITCSMSEEKFAALVKQYTTHFERNLKTFLTLLMETKRPNERHSNTLFSDIYVYDLITRLDYNGYYSKLYNLNLSCFKASD